jgi:SAM-dependent methyltransferase
LGIPGVADYTKRIIERGECRTALDIGCGVSSELSRFRPQLRTVGVDAHLPSIEIARQRNLHDDYIVADLLTLSQEELQTRVREATGETQFDLVTAVGVIEHLPKRAGWKLLEQCEALSRKYVLLETPNGFLEQGPEFGNPLQRHLSGWFPHDFQSLGYTVHGTTGTKYLRGYMGQAKLRIPGTLLFDQVVLSRLLRCASQPKHAFSIVAIKDARGVPARFTVRHAA